jgi:hypothetical protein
VNDTSSAFFSKRDFVVSRSANENTDSEPYSNALSKLDE